MQSYRYSHVALLLTQSPEPVVCVFHIVPVYASHPNRQLDVLPRTLDGLAYFSNGVVACG